MDVNLIDDEDLSLARKSVLPGEGFFIPDELEADRAEEEARETLAGASIAVVADTDADGLACVALVRAAFGEAALLPASPHDLPEALERLAAYAEEGVRAFVCDLCPDDYDAIAEDLQRVVERADGVTWYDHHQWDDAVAAAVREAGVDLVVGESERECTADVALRSLEYTFPARFRELTAVTRDHDLWIKDDPRSDDLADFARWADDEETYVETVREHGVDFPPGVQQLLDERRVEKRELIDRAVARADRETIGPWTVAVTYGRCSQNEVAERLRTDGADATVVVKPAGSASLRGSEGFARCHEVARQVNGGGHPKAAGCKPDIYDDMLDFAHHWTSRGAVAKQVILNGFRTLADDPDDEEGANADAEDRADSRDAE